MVYYALLTKISNHGLLPFNDPNGHVSIKQVFTAPGFFDEFMRESVLEDALSRTNTKNDITIYCFDSNFCAIGK